MKKFFYLLPIIACFTFVSCGSDDDEPTINFKDVSIAWNQTYNIPNGSGTTWTSSNDLIASVSGATIKANLVGEANLSSSLGSFKVSVTPTINLFKEPCLNWGTSKNAVKSYMNSFSLNDEDTNTLSYNGSGAIITYAYSFKNNELSGAGILVDSDKISKNDMITYLLERYIPVDSDESDYSFYFISPDEKTVVSMQLRSSGRKIVYVIIYIPVKSSKASYNIDFNKYFIDFNKYFPSFENAKSPEVTAVFESIKSSF